MTPTPAPLTETELHSEEVEPEEADASFTTAASGGSQLEDPPAFPHQTLNDFGTAIPGASLANGEVLEEGAVIGKPKKKKLKVRFVQGDGSDAEKKAEK